MARLARLRFVSVGHPNARLPDVCFDLRDAENAATDSTLWLRNGGGKSSILNLFFAVVRPDRREFLGGKADSRRRRLEDYVLPHDHAVVACEWELDVEGSTLDLGGLERRLITGVFYEWRSGAGDDSRLRRLYFSSLVGPADSTLAIDRLPLYVETEDGGRRRRTLSGFRGEWQALRERFPHLEIAATENQREWQEILEGAGIDPELFSYQIRMNQREGAADELFRFDEHEDFADFLLEVALDPELGSRVSRNIGTYRSELRERQEKWVPERELIRGLVERLGGLAELAVERRAALGEAGDTCAALNSLVTHVTARRDQLETEGFRLAAERRAAVERSQSITAEADAKRRRAAALRLFGARLRLGAAEEVLERAVRAREESDRERRCWEAAVPLRNALRHEERAREYVAELERKESEYAPLRVRLEESALDLAAALDTRAEELRAQEGTARQHERDARELTTERRDAAAAANAEAARAEAEADALERDLAEGRAARAELEVSGDLLSGETGAEASERLVQESERNEARQRRLLERARATREREADVQEKIATATAMLRESRVRLEATERELTEANVERRELEESPVLAQALEVEAVDLERASDHVVELVEGQAREILEAVIGCRIDRVEDDRAVVHLEDHGLLPPTRDTERVLAHLRDRIPGVWSGWAYLAENELPGSTEALARVRRAPEVALGVVVREADFAKAREILAELAAGDLPELPVVVASPSALEGEPPRGAFVVGPGTRAHFDRRAADSELARRRDRLERTDVRTRDLESRRGELDALGGRLRAFRRRYPVGWFVRHEEAVRELATEVDRRETELEALRTAREELQDAVERLGEERAQLEAAARLLGGRVERARMFVERYERHEDERERVLEKTRVTIAAARRGAEQALVSAHEASVTAEQASAKAKQLGEDARSVEEEARRIEYAPGRRDPTPDALRHRGIDDLRDRYAQLRDQYEQKVGTEGLLALSREAERQAREERGKFAALLGGHDLEESFVSSRLAELADPGLVEAERERAMDAYTSAFGTHGNASQSCTRARERLAQAETVASELGGVRELDETGAPGSFEAAESAATALTREIDQLEEERGACEVRAQELEVARLESERVAAAMAKDDERLGTLASAYEELLASIAHAAPDEPDEPDEPDGPEVSPPADGGIPLRIASLETELRAVKTRLGDLDERGKQGARAVREWAGDERFESLRSHWVRHFAASEDATLEAHAERWREELEVRLGTIEAQLAEIGKHRDLLLSELASATSEALALLRSAATHSRLPDSLPGLGGAQFLRVTLHTPEDPAESRGRLGDLIDEIASSAELASGLALVQRAVRRVARPIRFRVLCPDPHLDRRTVEVTEIQRFSGGEQLTAAILLYCTFAQVRARSRGVARRPSSVLLLDNPIGRASRVRFLELQREVARAMGIQLLYTTAVNDHEALRTLPNVIRLRNDRVDRNRGHRVVEAVSGDGEEGTENVRVLSPARIVRREPASDAGTEAASESEAAALESEPVDETNA